MENTNKKYTDLKILLSLLPTVLFFQNYAWMSSNANNGFPFFIIWALMIWSVWQLTEKNHILERLFRLTEISFFLLPVSVIILTVTATSGSKQFGAAIGSALAGTAAIFLFFIIGTIGGIIMHLITSKYEKKAEASNIDQPETLMNKHGVILPIVGVALLAVIMGSIAGSAVNQNSEPEKLNSQKNSTAVTVDTSKSVAQTSNDTSNKEQQTNIFAIGEAVKLSDYILTINSIATCVSDNEYLQPKEGYKYIAVDILQENNGSEPRDYNAYTFTLQDNESYSYQMTFSDCKSPNFGSGVLQPTMKTRGFITFEIPTKNQPDKLIFTPYWLDNKQIIVKVQK
ncbi:MAG: DUF4352 domain-containing protein [Minisyncoccales bacterium]